MRTLRLIGIGPGDPKLVTLAAVEAMAATDVFFVIDKGEAATELIDLRHEMLAAYARPDHRVITIADPPRDRHPADYGSEVRRWHAQRAGVLRAAMIAELPDDGTAAILVWGDPALYDSTLRLVDLMLADNDHLSDESDLGDLSVEVIPGVTSLSALTAAHRITANRIGEPIHITTGRRLARTPVGADTNQMVMLDAGCAFLDTAEPDDHIWWGAYIGTEYEILISGTVREVGRRIADERAAARERHGWIMDSYIVRKP